MITGPASATRAFLPDLAYPSLRGIVNLTGTGILRVTQMQRRPPGSRALIPVGSLDTSMTVGAATPAPESADASLTLSPAQQRIEEQAAQQNGRQVGTKVSLFGISLHGPTPDPGSDLALRFPQHGHDDHCSGGDDYPRNARLECFMAD